MGLGGLVMGTIVDRVGARRAMIPCVIIWGLTTFLTGFMGSFVMIIVMRAVLGFAETCNTPSCNRTIQQWFPKHERGRANSIWFLGVTLGPLVSIPLLTWLIAAFGWRGSFFTLGAIGIIPVALLLLLLYNSPEEHPRISKEELDYITTNNPQLDSGKVSKVDYSFLKSSTFWLCVITYTATNMFCFGIGSWMPVYLKETLGFSWAAMGGLATLPYLLASVGSIAAGAIADKIGKNAIVATICTVLAGVFIYLTTVFANPYVVTITMSLAVAFGMSAIPNWFACLINSSKSDQVGSASGIFLAFSYGGSAVAPVMIGAMASATGAFTGGFLSMAILCVVAAGAGVFLMKKAY